MQRLVLAVFAVVLFAACTIQEYEPQKPLGVSKAPSVAVVFPEIPGGKDTTVADSGVGTFAELDTTTYMEILVIGRIPASNSAVHWEKSFKPLHWLGKPPRSTDEAVVVAWCGERNSSPSGYCTSVQSWGASR